MGTGDKKKRREIHQFLNRFLLKDDKGSYSLREHEEARDMLAEYAEPLDGLFESTTTRYSMAIFAWNLSLVAEDRRGELMDDFLTPLIEGNDEGRKSLTDLIDSLVERRETLYPGETLLVLPDDSYVPPEKDEGESEDEDGAADDE